MNQSNQTLTQCIRANAEKIGAFLFAAVFWIAFGFTTFAGPWGN